MTSLTRWFAAALLCLLAAPALAETRLALVVANAAYEKAPLDNPTFDAKLVETSLSAIGFEVTVVENASLEALDTALEAFQAKAKGADLALFYFAGHGFAVSEGGGARNYLMSVDADVTSTSDRVIRAGGVALDEVIAGIGAAARTTLVFVDACRNDPRVSRAAGGRGRGLARIDDGTDNVFVGLSTRAGDVAADGEAGEGSPFARAFAAHIGTPGLRLDDAFTKVRLAVEVETGRDQRPDVGRYDLAEPLVLVKAVTDPPPSALAPVATPPVATTPASPPPGTAAPANACAEAREHFALAERLGSREMLEAHLSFFGGCAYAPAAKTLLAALDAKAEPPAAIPDAPPEAAPDSPAATAEAPPTKVREFRALAGHADNVVALAYSPDGRFLAGGSGDQTVIVWDVSGGAVRHTLSGHAGEVSAVAWSPDGTTIATASFDGTVKLWNPDDGAPRLTIEGDGTNGLTSVAFSPDSALLAGGSWDNTAKLWNAADGSLIRSLEGHADTVTALAFRPDGMVIATGSEDKTIKLWRVEDGGLAGTLEGHDDTVTSLAYGPEGHVLASGSKDRRVRTWLLSGEAAVEGAHTLGDHAGAVLSVAFDAAGQGWLASGAEDGTVKLWRVGPDATATLFETFKGHENAVAALAFNPGDLTLATGSWDHAAKIWSIDELSSPADAEAAAPEQAPAEAPPASLSDAVKAAPLGTLVRTLEGHEDVVHSVAFSPDGALAASGSDDRTVKLWRFEDGSLVQTLEGHGGFVHSVAFSPDGTLVASASDDRTVKLWRVEDGSLVRTLEGHEAPVAAVAFSPDGTFIASGAEDRTAKLWKVEDGSLVTTLEGHGGTARSVAFNPDGTFVASGSNDGTVKLWKVEDGSLVTTLEGHGDAVRSVAFGPDGTFVASGSNDGTVKLWKVEDGSLVQTLESHGGGVTSVAFGPDGTLIASGSNDKTAKLWRVEDGGLALTLEGHGGSVRSVAFSPDGTLVASGSDDKMVKLWNSTAPEASETGSDQDTSAAAGKAAFYERAADGTTISTTEGSVAWSADKSATGLPIVRAVIDLPDRGIAITIEFEKNEDANLPAGHVVKITFPADTMAPIARVAGLLAKPSEEARGTALAGVAAKVTDSLHLMALGKEPDDLAQNVARLREAAWFDLPIVVEEGGRKVLVVAFEKGEAGSRVFEEALAAWGEPVAAQ